MGRQSFHKDERLKKEKLIEELFKKGSYFNFPPIRIVYLPGSGDTEHHQVLFSVPSRNFRKAVDRNKLKRRMRESYRIRKQDLRTSPKWFLGFIYSAPSAQPYKKIDEAMEKAIAKLNVIEIRDGV